jgi:hypothetical protein
MYFASSPSDNFSTSVYLSSITIQIISIYNIFSRDNQPFSLQKIFYLFTLFFFGIAPLLQFYNGTTFFGSRKIDGYEYTYMNILIILILVFYQLFYTYFYKQKIKEKRRNFILKLDINKKLNSLQTFLIVSLSFASFLLIFNVNNNSILSMLFRGGELKDLVEMTSVKSLIVFNVFQPLAMMCLLYYISSKSKKILVYFILTLLAIVTCSPLGMPRFAAVAMYIPLLIFAVPLLKKKNIFSIVFILGLLIIFPFLENFRNYSGNSIQLGFNFEMFLQGHFDSYQNFTLVVSENIVFLDTS